MVNENRRELSVYRFQQAQETMEVAEDCFENGHYRDAINRSYYAAFYVANMQQLREKSDYDDFFIADKNKAGEQNQSARKIIGDVEYYLKCPKE